MNAQAGNMQCDMTALSSSEGSLYSGCCQSAGSGSDGEAMADTVDASASNSSSHYKIAGSDIRPPTWYKSPRNAVVKAAQHGRHMPESADTAVYGPLQAAVRKMSSGDQEMNKDSSPMAHSPAIHPKKKASSSSSSSRQELRKRLQEVKLTSESGNASVIEVIEPSSSEADDDDVLHIDGRIPRDQSTPLRGSHTRSFNASFSEELERARQSKRAGLIMMSASDAVNSNSKALAEPDLLAGTVVSVASALRADQLEQVEDEAEVNHSTRSHSSLSSSNNTAVTSVAAGPRKKSGGFLTKFALKARWPSKRKSSPAESPSLLTAASPTGDVTESSPDLSLTDQQQPNDASASNTSMSGVVAGLSQMFEDMSTGMKSPAKPQLTVGHHQQMISPSSRNNSLLVLPAAANAVSVVEPPETEHQDDEDDCGQVMDLPPSTSPPPVPLEIETYNSSPSSSQDASSSCSATGPMQPPPPPPRFSKSTSDLSGKISSNSKSSSASSSTSASHGGVESLSVAASEDSGIVMARPASSASKSDSSPRAAVSSTSGSTYATFTTFSPLRKSALTSTSTANAIHPDGERLSPAPSDKTESASASDLSKTESMRHFRQLARIEETGAVATAASAVVAQDGPDKSVDLNAPASNTTASIELGHQSGQILTWREAKLKNQVVTPPPLEERLNKVRLISFLLFRNLNHKH